MPEGPKTLDHRTASPSPDDPYPSVKMFDPVYHGQRNSHLCLIKPMVESFEQIEAGDYSYCANSEFIENILYHWGDNRLLIGRFCSIALGVEFCMGGNRNHNPNWITTYPFASFQGNAWQGANSSFELKGDTVIGNDVWIGYKAHIMPGVTIGDGAIIATKAVVTKDVQPYTIVGGNPAAPIRKRFPDETIAALLRIQWWNWPLEKIEQYLPLLCSNKIDQFITETDRKKPERWL